MGWLWAPDYTWGPAWVFWRHAEADGAIGWAPLPVGAVFVDGAFMYRGARVGVDFDFGLGEGVFVFVGYDHFHEGFFRMRGREYAWHIHGDRFHDYYRRSVLRNEFRRDEHGRFVNEGIGHGRMEQATHGRVERAGFEERRPVGDRASLAHQPAKTGRKPPAPGPELLAIPQNPARCTGHQRRRRRLRPQRKSNLRKSSTPIEKETMRKTYQAIGIAAVFLELALTTGCVDPNGQANNTGTGAIAGGVFGAVVGGLAGGRHAGRDALIGGLAGVVAGGLVGHMIDRDQQQRLQAQSPQTLQTIQHNDAVYQQQQQVARRVAQAPTPSDKHRQRRHSRSSRPRRYYPAERGRHQGLAAAGVKKDAITQELEDIGSRRFSPQDIAAVQQANPPVDPGDVIAYMKNNPS